jgi:ABC-type Fe3+/spermidine/putrescine transport system ATPase subunit
MVKVTLSGISKYFGEFKAVDDVDLEVGEGELFFLLGPSGCGKTTTLRVIAGFYKPDKGSVYFDDRPMNDVPPYRRNVGMVFQNYALWPHMTSYDNIVYGLKVRDVSPSERVKRARAVLDIVQMREFATRYPNQLSGGQQQRIALARAIVTEPDVLLLDEPLSNLDAKLRLETRREIRRIQREFGVTSIYVTHDQEEALSMADRIAIMNEGRLEQIGTPREVYGKPANSFVAGFIGETNFIGGEVESISPEDLIVVGTPSGEEIRAKPPSGGFAVGQKVLCSIRPEHIRILDKSAPVSGLDQFFEAEIHSLTYYGDTEYYVLGGFGGKDVKVTNFNPEAKKRDEGETVYITFETEDVEIFPY